MPQDRPQSWLDMSWRPAQLRALLVLVLLAAVGLGEAARRGGLELSDPPGVMPERVRSARERIDPNTAPEASLIRLDQIGPARARAIIADRQHGPYRSPEDLQRVRGIGPVIVARNAEYIVFDDPTGPNPEEPHVQDAIRP